MFEILKKEALNPTVMRMDIKAPLIAKKARAGQFIIVRGTHKGSQSGDWKTEIEVRPA